MIFSERGVSPVHLPDGRVKNGDLENDGRTADQEILLQAIEAHTA